MKRSFAYLFCLILLATTCRAADGDLFPYPKPSDDMTNLSERCDYIVSNFWKRCDFKTAMSKKEAFNDTFGDWVDIMPFATADTVHAAIDRLLASVSKSGPQTLELARMAEGWACSDTSEIYSEEIYYPFAKAAATNKKISGKDREYFRQQVQIMDNTRKGDVVKHLDFVTLDGKKKSLSDYRTQVVVVMFNDYKSDNCTLSRVRLSADINATALIRAGLLTVICLEPGEVDKEWREAASTYPEDWVVGNSADAREYFKLRGKPSIFLLDARHRLLVKDVPVDGLLSALASVRKNTGL